MATLREYVTFFREFRTRFETTGAIAPSSGFLASAMTGPLRNRPAGKPVRVLEIGPGTGAVTEHLVRLLKPGDTFDLVELNEVFADLLRSKFERDRGWRDVASQSTVHVIPLQQFEAAEPYDFVISGLPLNNFPADLVDDIFDAYFRLLAPGGVLSYFEYMYVRSVRKRVGKRAERERLCRIDQTMSRYVNQHRIRRNWIFVNVPPAWVQHLQRDA
jgi:phosphatidylethanolamine/phosphatidyl-N-methylethanolamine N-methyltransferase